MSESKILARFDALIAATSPKSRMQLARKIAMQLRKNNAKRIAEQKTPDGEAFIPRKEPNRNKKGRLRNKMFQKMATAKNLKARATPGAATVEFTVATGRLARVHHFGLEDNVRPGIRHRYAARQLLGINNNDQGWIEEALVETLKKVT